MHPTQLVHCCTKKKLLYSSYLFVETCNSINKTLALLSQTHKKKKKTFYKIVTIQQIAFIFWNAFSQLRSLYICTTQKVFQEIVLWVFV